MKSNGFTLLEIMVALAVFAILATITSSVMYHAFDTHARVTSQADRLNAVQLAVSLIKRDTEQMIERSIRGNEMHIFPPFIGQPYHLEFTRGGVVNPNGIEQRSTLKRIAFLCQKNQLIRRSWDRLDTPERKSYHDKILLDNIDQCSFAYLAHNRQILPVWQDYALQQNQRAETLPTAVKFTLNLRDWGNMSLLFIIPKALYAN